MGRAAGMVAQNGGQVSSSGVTANSPQQPSGLTSVYQHPPRLSSTDYAASGTHNKTSQSRPYPNATGLGSFRHPLANYQLDSGTTRISGGSNSASSHSSDPQCMPSYHLSSVQCPPEFPHYSPDMNNIQNHYSHARGDGSGVNATNPMDQETIDPVPNENAVDIPSDQSNDFGSEPGHVKRKRGPGKEKGYGRAAGTVAQNGSQVSSSGVTAHNPQQPSGLTSVYQHPPRLSSTDYAASGTHNKTYQSRSYPNATGPGSFRHPLANYQFDPGTTRMTGGNNSASSHSSDPQCMPSYYLSSVRPPEFPHYSPDTNNIHHRYSHARGDGSGGVNATSRMDQET